MTSSVAEGLVRMRGMVAELPSMTVDGFRAGREVAWPLDPSARRFFAAGLGASAAAADLARSLLDQEASVTLDVVRGEDLPRSADERTSVLVASYSGETVETLRAYDAAGRQGARRLVLTSGGTLAERAYDDDVPVVRVPPGLPPRSAVGYLFGGILGALDSAFPESNESRIRSAAESVRGRWGALAGPRGPARSIATGIGERLPFFVADRPLGAVARR